MIGPELLWLLDVIGEALAAGALLGCLILLFLIYNRLKIIEPLEDALRIYVYLSHVMKRLLLILFVLIILLFALLAFSS